MKYYQIKPDYSDKKQNYLEATHKWGLPGVSCNICNQVWSNVGIQYPSVDISELSISEELEEGWVASLSELKSFQTEIRTAFPEYHILPPGSEFGCLIGKEVGKKSGYFNDFIWNLPWTIILRENTLDKLHFEKLKLPKTIEPIIKFKTQPQKIYEFEILPFGNLLNPIFENNRDNACLGCDRIGVSMPHEILVEKETIPIDLDIFRLTNFSTIIVITERLVEAAKRLQLKGAIFNEIKVI